MFKTARCWAMGVRRGTYIRRIKRGNEAGTAMKWGSLRKTLLRNLCYTQMLYGRYIFALPFSQSLWTHELPLLSH